MLQPAPGKVVLGGFSQGAMLALDVALHSPSALAGLVVALGDPHRGRASGPPRFEARRGTAGLHEPRARRRAPPLRDRRGPARRPDRAGLPVEWVPFQGGHGIPAGVVDAVGAFLTRVLA